MNALSVLWYAVAIAGVLAVVVALGVPRRRRDALLIAFGCLAIAGVLFMPSVGIAIVGLAIVCFVVARRRHRSAVRHAGGEPPATTLQ